MQIVRLIQAFFLAKSSRFKSADFASVMTDDVGCSGRHQCTHLTHVVIGLGDSLAPNKRRALTRPNNDILRCLIVSIWVSMVIGGVLPSFNCTAIKG